MRAFFAIPMPEAGREALAAAQASLSSAAGLAWTEPVNFHLTLAFLGEVDDRELEAARLRLVQTSVPRESARLCGVGAFPSLACARVLWVGVRGAGESLSRLHAELRSRQWGQTERPFVPHVTIARARGASAVDLRRLAGDVANRDIGSFELAPVVLYESLRSPSGSRYREIARRE